MMNDNGIRNPQKSLDLHPHLLRDRTVERLGPQTHLRALNSRAKDSIRKEF